MSSHGKKYTFHVHGMHCASCVLLTEQEIGKLPHVSHVRSHLHSRTIDITGNFGNKTPEEIAAELTVPLHTHGYTLSTEKEERGARWDEFKIAIPVAIACAVIFFALQNLGLVDLTSGGSVTYGTAFIVGIIASLSTCMAVVGGLLLSMSATFAKKGAALRPQMMFHAGRIVSFFVLGGIIGTLGTAFTLSPTATFIMSILIAAVMLILGINLLDVFHWSKKLQPSMPKFIARRAHGATSMNHALTPLLVGIATFFLPCGFTQSMQLYTLTTGSFLAGGLTMLAFALGTLPVLALISFSSFNIKNSAWSGTFFKTAGLVVIMFALFNLGNSFAAAGITSGNLPQSGQNTATSSATTTQQIIEITAKGGYSPRTSVAKANIPTVLRVTTRGTFDCSAAIRIPSLGIAGTLPNTGSTDIDLGTPSVGVIRGTCSMGMYSFEIEFRN